MVWLRGRQVHFAFGVIAYVRTPQASTTLGERSAAYGAGSLPGVGYLASRGGVRAPLPPLRRTDRDVGSVRALGGLRLRLL